MPSAYWLNSAWMAMCAAEARAFARATREVRATQEKLLMRMLRQNEATAHGRKYNFRQIKSVAEYRDGVPLMTPESLRTSVDRIAGGEENVLTRERVTLLEPTGGSTGEKLIPYTRGLRRQFQRAVAAWVHDVMKNIPRMRRGRAYWSISPPAEKPRRTAAGIPIGFADDREYLSTMERWAVSRLLVTPREIRNLQYVENARYLTLLYLLSSQDLTLISVWSPTYLTALLAEIPRHIDSICRDLRQGRVCLPQPQREAKDNEFRRRPQPRRAEELQSLFSDSHPAADQIAACWPQLALVSCWADASSQLYASQLRELIPHATLQPKGLLATEGVVSFPLVEAQASVLAVRSHFFEFVEEGVSEPAANDTALAHELEVGRHYRVILTTGGGLYRYDLGDEVEMIGFHNGCPLIRFVGRSDAISDLVGEKLHESHVRQSIQRVCSEMGLRLGFAMLAPSLIRPPKYLLYVAGGSQTEHQSTMRLASRMQERLEENPQYKLAIELRQLQPLEVCWIEKHAWQRYEHVCLQRGQTLGDIKPKALDSWTGWEDVFSESKV